MTDLKTHVIDDIIRIEGGYANNPNDSGGETKYGVTIAVARNYGYDGPMIDMPREIAVRIYEDLYWNSLRLDEICAMSEPIAAELADTGVNMGIGRAARFLQRSLNAFNQRADLFPDLTVDGYIGGKSIQALTVYLQARATDGEKVMMRALNALQGARYIKLAESREKDEDFVFGWMLNRVC